MTRNEVRLDDVVSQSASVPFSKFDQDYTKTSLFILNMLNYRFSNMPVNFVNAFVGDAGWNNEIEYPLFLVFKTDIKLAHRDRSWVHFEKSLLEHVCFKYKYYAGKEGEFDLVVYVFEIPEFFQEDYLKFLDGKYSGFSEGFKAIFPKVTTLLGQPKPSLHYKVIEKDPNLKGQIEDILGVHLDDKAELWAKPELSREIFRYSGE